MWAGKKFNLCVFKGCAVEIVLLSFLGVGIAGAVYDMFFDDDPIPNRSDGSRDDGDGSGAPNEPSTDLSQVSEGATIDGSGQADVFSLSDDVDGDFTADVNGGAGDDRFNLTRPDGSAFLVSGSLDGGAGKDYFEVSG